MTRLTEKDTQFFSCNIDEDISSDLTSGYDLRGGNNICSAIEKLGELEDIEEELGIDLITLFEILKSENIYANGKRYDNSNSLSYMGNSWLIFNHQAKQGFRFKDYGKTWALTKEELEK